MTSRSRAAFPRRLIAVITVSLNLLLTGAVARASNPVITDVFTADPAALVHNGTVYLQSIIEFRGQSYFIYHNGALQVPNGGGSFRRSVCIDYLYYNPDGTMRRVVQTTEGLSLRPLPRDSATP